MAKARFNFGKYNGREIEEIRFKDRNYFDWAYKTVDRFRELVDSLEPVTRRTKKATERPKHSRLDHVPYNPDHVTREGWRGDGPCTAVEAYKRMLADEPDLPYLHPCHMHLDPTFDPQESKPEDAPW